MTIVKHCSVDTYKTLMDFLLKLLKENTLDKASFSEILTYINGKNHYSSFAQAINNPDKKILPLYCTDIKEFYYEKKLSKNNIRTLILNKAIDNTTPMYCACSTSANEKFDEALGFIIWSYNQEIINPEAFIDLLLGTNNLGYNPIHQICNHGDYERLEQSFAK